MGPYVANGLRETRKWGKAGSEGDDADNEDARNARLEYVIVLICPRVR